jgi:hypothetical protein
MMRALRALAFPVILAVTPLAGRNALADTPANGRCWSDTEARKIIDSDSGWLLAHMFKGMSSVSHAHAQVCPMPDFGAFPVCSIEPARGYYASRAASASCLSPPDRNWDMKPIKGKAAYDLGVKYYNGNGVSKDRGAASAWFTQAGNYGPALYLRGYIYAHGLNGLVNYRAAKEDFESAIRQGYVGAYAALGLLYQNGQGVPQSNAEAVRLYRLGARAGDGYAMYDLGGMYGDGLGVPQDLNQAEAWLNKAIAEGRRDGDADLVRMATENLNIARSATSGNSYGSSPPRSNCGYHPNGDAGFVYSCQ